ncbi:hypothetical protein KI387_004385, partial [Taxus chinensis]
KMVRTRGNVASNAPPEGGAATTQKLDEILAALLDTRDRLAVLEQQVMGNEEDEKLIIIISNLLRTTQKWVL